VEIGGNFNKVNRLYYIYSAFSSVPAYFAEEPESGRLRIACYNNMKIKEANA
jgi:hypothetical protein